MVVMTGEGALGRQGHEDHQRGRHGRHHAGAVEAFHR